MTVPARPPCPGAEDLGGAAPGPDPACREELNLRAWFLSFAGGPSSSRCPVPTGRAATKPHLFGENNNNNNLDVSLGDRGCFPAWEQPPRQPPASSRRLPGLPSMPQTSAGGRRGRAARPPVSPRTQTVPGRGGSRRERCPRPPAPTSNTQKLTHPTPQTCCPPSCSLLLLFLCSRPP